MTAPKDEAIRVLREALQTAVGHLKIAAVSFDAIGKFVIEPLDGPVMNNLRDVLNASLEFADTSPAPSAEAETCASCGRPGHFVCNTPIGFAPITPSPAKQSLNALSEALVEVRSRGSGSTEYSSKDGHTSLKYTPSAGRIEANGRCAHGYSPGKCLICGEASWACPSDCQTQAEHDARYPVKERTFTLAEIIAKVEGHPDYWDEDGFWNGTAERLREALK